MKRSIKIISKIVCSEVSENDSVRINHRNNFDDGRIEKVFNLRGGDFKFF